MNFLLDYPWLAGAIADLPTPFDAQDNLDLAAFARLCERQIDAGATADRKSTRLNSSHSQQSRMPSSA